MAAALKKTLEVNRRLFLAAQQQERGPAANRRQCQRGRLRYNRYAVKPGRKLSGSANGPN